MSGTGDGYGGPKSMLRDHTGKWSMSRCTFAILTLIYTPLFVLDAFGVATIAEAGWTWMGSSWGLAVLWAGGPPIAAALSGVVNNAVTALRDARAHRRKGGDA